MVGEVQRRAQHDGGADVVAARVRHARHLAAVGNVLLVGHRKRVEVGAQGECAVDAP